MTTDVREHLALARLIPYFLSLAVIGVLISITGSVHAGLTDDELTEILYSRGLSDAAERGNADAQYWLGYRYDYGRWQVGTDASGRGINEKAMIWYRKAAEQGHADAQYKLGWFYANGTYPDNRRDFPEAMKWYEKASAQGNSAASFEMGRLYDFMLGKETKQLKMKWYRKAAEQGHPNAQSMLGLCYMEGLGVPKDVGESLKWYREAAEQGESLAQCALGRYYTSRDDFESFKWYSMAVENGMTTVAPNCDAVAARLSQAQKAEVTRWFQAIRSRPSPKREPLQYLTPSPAKVSATASYSDTHSYSDQMKQLAESGDAVAQLSLGICYGFGKGIRIDRPQEARWYREAANQGNAIAQNNLGCCYLDGTGVPQDYILAYKWLNLAAAGGVDGAAEGRDKVAKYLSTELMKVARRLSTEFRPLAAHNVPAPLIKHWKYRYDSVTCTADLQSTAEAGDAEAQFWLGVCFRDGKGVPKDEEKAASWFLRAAEQGFADAQACVASCYSDGTGVKTDAQEAMRWYRKAAEQGVWVAQNNLAVAIDMMHRHDVEAFKWYNLAAAQRTQYSASSQARDEIADHLSAHELIEGQRMSREFVPVDGRKQDAAATSPINQAPPLSQELVGSTPGSKPNGFFDLGSQDGRLGSIANRVSTFLGELTALFVCSLLVAFVLQGATRIVCKFVPPYWTSYIATCITTGGSILLNRFIRIVTESIGERVTGTTVILSMVVTFFVMSALLTVMIKRPDKESIGFGNACLISTIQLLVGIITYSAIAVVVALAKT